MQEVTFNATDPPLIYFSEASDSIAIVNRSEPLVRPINQVNTNTSRVLKDKEQTVDNAFVAITELNLRLKADERFDTIVILDSMKYEANINQNLVAMAPPLTWEEVDSLCALNHSDILMALEMFTINSSNVARTPQVTGNPINDAVGILNSSINVTTSVRMGIRIYDSRLDLILEEFQGNEIIGGRSQNGIETVQKTVGRNRNIMKATRKMINFFCDNMEGKEYVAKRNIYTSGNKNMKGAYQLVKMGNWDKARLIWNDETKSNKRKVAAMACHNLAVFHERKDEIPVAAQWSHTARVNLRMNETGYYSRILFSRMQRLNQYELNKNRVEALENLNNEENEEIIDQDIIEEDE